MTKFLIPFILLFSTSFVGFSQDSLNLAVDSLLVDTPSDSLAELTPIQEESVLPLLEDFHTKVESSPEGSQLVLTAEGIQGTRTLKINSEVQNLDFQNGVAKFPIETDHAGSLMMLSLHKDKKTAKGYGDYKLIHVAKRAEDRYRLVHIPLWLSIIPPLIAIFLALLTREVNVSLFAGVWAGAFIVGGLRIDSLYYFLMSFWESLSNFVINSLTDPGHLSVIVFSLMIGGMVAIISRNGGMAGIVLSLSKYAQTPRTTQFITWLLGVAIFFDDYANTLIVGNTMRSVTDKFRISREKLAYIVDSTAAPVSAVAFITTWIGAELGYIESGISQLEGFDASMSPYAIFLSSLKYSFYPILTLLFILIIIFTKRDFGQMLKAERRARSTGQVSRPKVKDDDHYDQMEDLAPVKGAKLRWYNAFIPVAVVILMTVFGLLDTGMEKSYASLQSNGAELGTYTYGNVWSEIDRLGISEAENAILNAEDINGLDEAALAFLDGRSLVLAQAEVQASSEKVGMLQKLGILVGNSDSYQALLWASLSGVFVAILLTLFGRIMTLNDTMDTLVAGFKSMLPALLILSLAWALADITGALYTKDFLTSTISDKISPFQLPMIVFVLAALIAFSTGSSWSTMAILYPIAIPATWATCQAAGIDPTLSMELLLNVISVVLAASVLGDHCSPISDTTILSSLASDCDHIDHVRTQMPYALTVGLASFICAGLSTYLGGGWLISGILLLASLGALYGVVMFFGRRVD